MTRKQLLKTARKVLTVLILAAVLYFMAKVLRNNFARLDGADFLLHPYAILGGLSFMAAVVLSGIYWGELMTKLAGKPVGMAEAVRVHISSWLLKYVPSQTGSFINKLAWGNKRGIAKSVSVVAFFYENALLIVASLLLAVPGIILVAIEQGADNYANPVLFVPLAAGLAFIVVLYGQNLNRLISLLTRFTKYRLANRDLSLSRRDTANFLWKFCLPRLINGLGFLLLVLAFEPVAVSAYPLIVSAYIFAGAAGILFIFVPSGLGVREAVIAIFLQSYFDFETAFFLATIARIYTVIADAGLGVAYLALKRREA